MIILATLRGEFEDQPGEIGNFARRFWRIAGKVGNFTREIWKSRRPSAERVAHWCQDVAAWARDSGLQPRGGGGAPGPPTRGTHAQAHTISSLMLP